MLGSMFSFLSLPFFLSFRPLPSSISTSKSLLTTLLTPHNNSYTIRLNVSKGSFEDFYVVDGGGQQVTTSTSLSDADPSVNFTLAEPIDDAFLAAWTRDVDVGVEYSVANATKPTASAAGKITPGSIVVLSVVVGVVAAVTG